MLRIFEKIVDNYKVDPGKLDSLVLRKGLMDYDLEHAFERQGEIAAPPESAGVPGRE
jgi:hypothetical protein